ncbi:MAG: hypothetical protein RJA07_1932 [Bacteroidota bacterium]|jgi:hypothetical protein
MQPRIKNIISISSFAIVCEWTNGEIRTINFYDLKETLHSNVMDKILLPNVFNTVKIDALAKTLSWENQMPFIDYDGTQKMGALDFCPDVLYSNSTLVK